MYSLHLWDVLIDADSIAHLEPQTVQNDLEVHDVST
jgi:hypothetical protein